MGARPEYAAAAREVGRLLARRSIDLVYGGGNVGLMGTVADACMSSGGHVIGVIPQLLVDKELAHHGISELHVVETMHERKQMMADLADGFLALPGGFGTWDEFCEILTWAQLGIQSKGGALLNVAGYYDPLIALADRAVQEGFVWRPNRALILDGTNAAELLDRLDRFEAPSPEKWLNRGAR